MVAKEAAKGWGRKATKKKSRKATQYSLAFHLLSQSSPEKSKGKKKLCGLTPGIKLQLLLHRNTSIHTFVNYFILEANNVWRQEEFNTCTETNYLLLTL